MCYCNIMSNTKKTSTIKSSKEVKNQNKKKDTFKDKIVLVTGGTGSFGKKLVEILLKNHNPKSIRIYSRDELKQWEMRNQFNDHSKLRFFIGDIRDRNRLKRATKDTDIIIHCTALKQVPICEYNPIEAINTNINGAINIIDAALDNKIKLVISLSTDKAVSPVNLYGATKLCAEKLFTQANSYAGTKNTKFSSVRYGNVVGSRGSVIPLFLKQKEIGEITITFKEMTRFWITLDQAVQFVINSIGRMHGGEVFVPKIPSVKIIDLAKAIAPEAKIKIICIRPGEKLHEILISYDEARHTKEFVDSFIIEPQHPFWKINKHKGGTYISNHYIYISSENDKWLTHEEIKNLQYF